MCVNICVYIYIYIERAIGIRALGLGVQRVTTGVGDLGSKRRESKPEKNVEHEMETAIVQWFLGFGLPREVVLGSVHIQRSLRLSGIQSGACFG